jgi:hypothetical protein
MQLVYGLAMVIMTNPTTNKLFVPYLETKENGLTTAHMMRFQVLMAASMKLRIFWDVLPCS